MAISDTHKGQQTHTKTGGIVGRVMDALSGENRTHRIDPDREDSYWRENYRNVGNVQSGASYDDYAPGFRTGYEGYCSCEPGTRFEDIESRLQQDYTARNPKLPWSEARHHAKSAWDRVERGEAFTIPLSEEELSVSKRQVEAGSAQLRKVVKTETVNQPVELHREEAVIERVTPTTQKVPDNAFQEQTINVPLKREEAVVSKTAHVTGEVKVTKGERSETKTVSEKLRHEEVEIDKTGSAEIHKDKERR